MTKLRLSYCLIILLLISCSVEKINFSPIGDSAEKSSDNQSNYTLTERKNLIFYSSEITNLIATFPKFKNDAVNYEVAVLKLHLKDYLGAMEEYNLKGLKTAEKKFEKSYKNLQKLRKYLQKDEDEVLNRYLVRIKINMSQLNSNIPQDSISIN